MECMKEIGMVYNDRLKIPNRFFLSIEIVWPSNSVVSLYCETSNLGQSQTKNSTGVIFSQSAFYFGFRLRESPCQVIITFLAVAIFADARFRVVSVK